MMEELWSRVKNTDEDIKSRMYELMNFHFPNGVYHPAPFFIERNMAFHELMNLRVGFWENQLGIVNPTNFYDFNEPKNTLLERLFKPRVGQKHDDFFNCNEGGW